MQIRMLHKISGTRNGQHWPERGEVIELPDVEAVELVRSRMATHVEAPAVPEKATSRKPATRRKTA